jgi:Holliday junction resolvasome RuvABC endonuclease subunit
MLKIVALDPSYNNTGAVSATIDKDLKLSVHKLYLIQPEKTTNKERAKLKIRKSNDDIRRARFASEEIHNLVKNCDIVFAEIPVAGQSARAAFSFGIVYGILAGIKQPLVELTPQEVKVAATGIKTATKEEMMAWAYEKYPHLNWRKIKRNGEQVLKKDSEHEADAIGVLHAGLAKKEFLNFLKTYISS